MKNSTAFVSLAAAAALGFCVTVAQAHDDPPGEKHDHRTRLLCDYVVSGEQKLAGGREVHGERSKTNVAYDVDWEASTVSRVDLDYPAQITDDRIQFRIGAVDYEIDRASLVFKGRSSVKTASGEAELQMNGVCKAPAEATPAE